MNATSMDVKDKVFLVHPLTGKILRATWTVTGAKEYGLPTASDERVYLVLMELSRESSFRERSVVGHLIELGVGAYIERAE